MNSFISWIGGKKLLRNKIVEQIEEAGEIERYIEVFGGAGWVLFAKERHAKMEVYNDINGSLVNLYRCVKYHPEALQKELDGIVMSRELFFDAVSETRGLTDIQRAARFFIAIKESYGADCRSFGITPKDMPKAADFLTLAAGRLRRVVIENLDFEHLIRTYDRQGALFYLDPPYYSAERYYPDRFNPEDHVRLRNRLDSIKGKFIVSYNDCQAVRELYSGYNVIQINRNHNLTCKTGSRRYDELIIKNY